MVQSTKVATIVILWKKVFLKFTGKHPCQSFFFNKVAGLRRWFWLKLDLWNRRDQNLKLEKSHPEAFYKKGVLRNFTKLTWIHLCQSKNKEILAQVFSCEFCEISKNNFFTEHFRTLACFWIHTLTVPYLGFIADSSISTFYCR